MQSMSTVQREREAGARVRGVGEGSQGRPPRGDMEAET